MDNITYTIEGSWITLNEYINAERSNRFKAAKMKREETDRMLWQIKNTKLPSYANFSFQAFVKDKKKDPDNIYILFCKFFLDALVKKGCMENDGQRQVGQIIFEPVQHGHERMVIVVS